VPTDKHFRPTRAAQFFLAAVLAAGCVPSQAVEPSRQIPIKGSAGDTHAPQSDVVTPPPRPVRRLVIIQAHVDSRRRIVSGTSSPSVLGSSLDALARELTPNGVLTRGTAVDAVYETYDGSASRDAERHLVALRVGTGPEARVGVLSGDGNQSTLRAYSLDGRAISRDLLRYPVAHLRITSGYALSRRHPITKKRRPHLGVDFAAPFGTPVVAVGDGEVVLAKWLGGYGRLVRIEHDGGYESAYAHLQRYATGVKAGSRVTKGQVIGYVGNSGTATGPHLHFALLRDGTPLDPLSPEIPSPPRLAGEALTAHHADAIHVVQILAAADREHAAATRVASAKR